MRARAVRGDLRVLFVCCWWRWDGQGGGGVACSLCVRAVGLAGRDRWAIRPPPESPPSKHPTPPSTGTPGFVLWYAVPPVNAVTEYAGTAGSIACVYGAALTLSSALMVGVYSFLGEPQLPRKLVMIGPYSIVRHPQILGNFLFIMGAQAACVFVFGGGRGGLGWTLSPRAVGSGAHAQSGVLGPARFRWRTIGMQRRPRSRPWLLPDENPSARGPGGVGPGVRRLGREPACHSRGTSTPRSPQVSRWPAARWPRRPRSWRPLRSTASRWCRARRS